MSIDAERKVYCVNVTITETRYAKALVEAESEEDAVAAVRDDPELLDFGPTDEDVDITSGPDFNKKPQYGAVAGALLAIDSDEYQSAMDADRENPVDDLTLPLFA